MGASWGDIFKPSGLPLVKSTGDMGAKLLGTNTKVKSSTEQIMPDATPMQGYAEDQLFRMLQGYNPFTQQQGMASQTGNILQRLLGYGMNATPEQNTLLEGQTANFMQGLQQLLGQQQQTAMSQAQQDALRRGIPLSDIARGQEANVGAQMMGRLAQGYGQAKGQELQNKLQYPMQNLDLMSRLQQQFTSPFQNLASSIGMSRYNGPRNTTSTNVLPWGTPGTPFGSGGAFGAGGFFGSGGMNQALSQEGRGWVSGMSGGGGQGGGGQGGGGSLYG